MSRHHAALDRRRWAQTRRAALERAGWRCEACGRAGRLEADHIEPLDAGGEPYDLENVQALCRGCHADKTRRERRGIPPPEVEAWESLLEGWASTLD